MKKTTKKIRKLLKPPQLMNEQAFDRLFLRIVPQETRKKAWEFYKKTIANDFSRRTDPLKIINAINKRQRAIHHEIPQTAEETAKRIYLMDPDLKVSDSNLRNILMQTGVPHTLTKNDLIIKEKMKKQKQPRKKPEKTAKKTPKQVAQEILERARQQAKQEMQRKKNKTTSEVS